MENEYLESKSIYYVGVPQGSVLRPVIYLLYTYDIPEIDNIKLATFVDDTAVLTIYLTMEETSADLQNEINSI